MKAGRQTTLREQAALSGIGVHSGSASDADAASGRRRYRHPFSSAPAWKAANAKSAPTSAAVTATEFATVLGDASGPLVSTAEHVLAALRGLGVDNAVVEIDGPEAPIMDGSAAPFVAAIDQAGIETLPAPRRYHPRAQAGARRAWATPMASCGPMRAASASRPRSSSIIR